MLKPTPAGNVAPPLDESCRQLKKIDGEEQEHGGDVTDIKADFIQILKAFLSCMYFLFRGLHNS